MEEAPLQFLLGPRRRETAHGRHGAMITAGQRARVRSPRKETLFRGPTSAPDMPFHGRDSVTRQALRASGQGKVLRTALELMYMRNVSGRRMR